MHRCRLGILGRPHGSFGSKQDGTDEERQRKDARERKDAERQVTSLAAFCVSQFVSWWGLRAGANEV
jgi:hypothetical protein